MRALTVLQPWATCIARHGKDVENRTWAPSALVLPPGSLLAIHAGRSGFDHDGWDFIRTERLADGEWDELSPLRVHRGVVVAVVEFAGTYHTSLAGKEHGPWAFGPTCWLLANRRPLPEPVPCRGAQGLWTLPADVEARVLAQIGGGA